MISHEHLYDENISYMKDIYRFQERAETDQVILTYQGEVTQDIIRSLTALIENNLAKIHESEAVIGRVFHVMIECLQNVIRHGDVLKKGVIANQRSGIYLEERANHYLITTGNLISNSKIDSLREIIDRINGMDKVQLKQYYYERVADGKISDKGGAGLGFIEMARKTKAPIVYHFEQVNEEVSYILLNLCVQKQN